MESHQHLPEELPEFIQTFWKYFAGTELPGVFPMDPRGLKALEANRNNERNGRESEGDGAFQAHDFGREDLRREVQAVDSDARFVHDVGDRAADAVAPWEIAGPGADVWL